MIPKNQEFGAKVIGVIEYNGAVYNSNGLDVKALKEYQVGSRSNSFAVDAVTTISLRRLLQRQEL